MSQSSSEALLEAPLFVTVNRTLDYSVTQTFLVRVVDGEEFDGEELRQRVSDFVEGRQTPELSIELGVAQIDDTMSQIENSESFDDAEPSDGNVNISADYERLMLREKSELLHDALRRLINEPGEASTKFATELLDQIAASAATDREMLERVISSVDSDDSTPIVDRG